MRVNRFYISEKNLSGVLKKTAVWATQTGSRAKFLLKNHVKGQIIDFYYRFIRFFYEVAIFQRL